jgi:hypothetical protein
LIVEYNKQQEKGGCRAENICEHSPGGSSRSNIDI